ncbi:MAG: hypothetical protein ACQGVK_18845 [Myxococcota bacterium]
MATTSSQPTPRHADDRHADDRHADDRRLQASTARRRRLFCTALAALGVLAAAGSARAGGVPAFSALEQQVYCESVAASRVGPESWDEAVGAFEEADALLAEVETHLCMARFQVALERVQHGRQELEDLPEVWQSSRRRARLEIMAATAKIALGDPDSAQLNFHWALEIDPYLELDAAQTSPKVLQMFREARASFVAAR